MSDIQKGPNATKNLPVIDSPIDGTVTVCDTMRYAFPRYERLDKFPRSLPSSITLAFQKATHLLIVLSTVKLRGENDDSQIFMTEMISWMIFN